MRISREQMFKEIVQIIAQRSTCKRASVGAILIKDYRIISTGYNGAPHGAQHCLDAGCNETENGCDRTVHAEANAVAFAAKNGIATEGSSLYTTVAPCYTCAKLLINAGIDIVYFLNDYRNMDGLKILISCGVEYAHL